MTSSYPQFIRAGKKIFALAAISSAERIQGRSGAIYLEIHLLDGEKLILQGPEAEGVWQMLCFRAGLDFAAIPPTSVEVAGLPA